MAKMARTVNTHGEGNSLRRVSSEWLDLTPSKTNTIIIIEKVLEKKFYFEKIENNFAESKRFKTAHQTHED